MLQPIRDIEAKIKWSDFLDSLLQDTLHQLSLRKGRGAPGTAWGGERMRVNQAMFTIAK